MEHSLECHAPAKINLSLHITGKRADGYHLLESLVSFAAIHDTVTIEQADRLSLSVTGPFATALGNDENILLKAAKLLGTKAGKVPNIHISLHKNIPVGAGIGGGSADAAALLHLLSRFWELAFPDKEMLELALQLGADVPVCYTGKSAFFSGIGEKIRLVDYFPSLPAVLVNPLISLATPSVFRARTGDFSASAESETIPENYDAFIPWLSGKKNDLEPAAICLLPVITDILTALKGQPDCILARMSGSGATCFGLFPDKNQAEKAAAQLRNDHPAWWVQETTIGDGCLRL